MTDKNNKDIRLEDAIAALRDDNPDASELRSAGERVWSRLNAKTAVSAATDQIRGCEDVWALMPALRSGELSPARALLVETHLRECASCRHRAHLEQPQAQAWSVPVAPARNGWSGRQFALVAAAMIFIVLGSWTFARQYFAAPEGARVTVQSVDGSVFRLASTGPAVLRPGDELGDRDVLRTGGQSHAFVRLLDGSVVEMSEHAELSVGARRKDTTVYLNQGRIIVQAAKRQTGHLYVVTPDARVAVTGTVFSVNSGMKGVRVAVIEGEVHVDHGGVEDVLHSGDQVASSERMTAVPVRDEIAWSRNLDKHLALLAQFAKLQKKFEQIPMPGLRYSSALLARVPADTMVYAAIPNLGEAINEANRIFHDQLQQSPDLREWWERGKHDENGTTFEEMLQKVHALSQYIGEEVVFVALPGQKGSANLVLMAEARRSDLRDFLQNNFTATVNGKTKPVFLVVDDAQLASASPKGELADQIIALVRSDVVMFSSDPVALRRVASSTAAGAFEATDFGRRISASYANGAEFLLAVDIHRLIAQQPQSDRPSRRSGAQAQRHQQSLENSGFDDARYFIAEHRDDATAPENRALFEFAGQRHGVASWLAPPAPMGSLEFVSPSAGLVSSIITKSPALMVDDLVQMADSSEPRSRNDIAELESKLGISIRDDLAASFGSDATFALDGPLLPTPSWKLIAQVQDAARLQASIGHIVEAVNRELSSHQRPGVALTQQDVNGRTYFMLKSLDPRSVAAEVHYTYSDGYLVAAASRALVMSALRVKETGNSLVRSSQLQSLLPKDEHANFSALFYQNLAPVIDPIASQLTPSQLQSLREIAADSKPTAVCVYGGENSIELVSGNLLPINLNQLAFGAVMGHHTGAAHK